MKKCILLLCVFFLNTSFVYLQNFDNDVSVRSFSEIENVSYLRLKKYYDAESWPLLIQKGENFLESYPFSSKKDTVVLYVGESYYYTFNIEKAKNCFNKISHIKKAQYWLGMIASTEMQYVDSLNFLYPLVKNPFGVEELDKNVLLTVAQSLSALERHEDLQIILEYYIKTYGVNSIPTEIENLLGSLWLGLAIESFEQQKFGESLEYFARADNRNEKVSKNELHKEISGLYQAIIYEQQGETERSIELLESRIEPLGEYYFEYSALLSMLYGNLDNLELSELYAKKAISAYDKQKNVSSDEYLILLESSIFRFALSLYEKKDYLGVNAAIEYIINVKNGVSLKDETLLLYAQSLFLSGDIDSSLSLLSRIPYKEERIKALYLDQQWVNGALESSTSDDYYLKGLGFFYQKNWVEAYNSFTQFLNEESNVDTSWADYYAGLCLYYEGDYVTCLNHFKAFTKKYAEHPNLFDVSFVQSVCALQSARNEQSLQFALESVSYAKTYEERMIAKIFAANLYIDMKQYESANLLLQEYSIPKDASGISSQMLLAETYEKMGLFDQASAELGKIMYRFPKEDLTREAALRRGEIYFSEGDYEKAEMLFRDFRLNFSEGLYSDLALFNEAGARYLLDDVQGSLVLYTDLVTRYRDSVYRFSAIRKMIRIHKDLGEYASALELVVLVEKDYPVDFVNSNLVEQKKELTTLASTNDEKLAFAKLSWEKDGGNDTSSGREKAFELVVLYKDIDIDSSYKFALELERKLQAIQNEYELKAKLYNVLAGIEREQNNYSDAAYYFLQEVEALVMIDDSVGKKERALFSAVEAFDSCGKTADAQAVLNQMSEYKDSIWYERATQILNNGN